MYSRNQLKTRRLRTYLLQVMDADSLLRITVHHHYIGGTSYISSALTSFGLSNCLTLSHSSRSTDSLARKERPSCSSRFSRSRGVYNKEFAPGAENYC